MEEGREVNDDDEDDAADDDADDDDDEDDDDTDDYDDDDDDDDDDDGNYDDDDEDDDDDHDVNIVISENHFFLPVSVLQTHNLINSIIHTIDIRCFAGIYLSSCEEYASCS